MEKGITKHRFMALRDELSSSQALGFRIQGMLMNDKPLASKYLSTRRSAAACQHRFVRFFRDASPPQKENLYNLLQEFYEAAKKSVASTTASTTAERKIRKRRNLKWQNLAQHKCAKFWP